MWNYESNSIDTTIKLKQSGKFFKNSFPFLICVNCSGQGRGILTHPDDAENTLLPLGARVHSVISIK